MGKAQGGANTGKAYLVGAGPGRVDYLTQRAAALLAGAEVVVYDALVSAEVLAAAAPTCQLIAAGKRGGRKSIAQASINELLVQQVLAGRQVVRLKSGDPFIFGRCTSEIQALLAAGCAFEVVPGISSGLAGPLLAGIPLTDPVLSRCFAVASAHEPDALDWGALAKLDTLVFLMVGRSLPQIVGQLVRHGRSPTTPAAAIRSAGHPQQQVWLGELESIVVQTAGIELSPAVLVVGEVVRLRQFLQPGGVLGRFVPSSPDPPFPMTPPINDPTRLPLDPNLPLAGRTVLVTRAAGQAAGFLAQLQGLGAEAIEVPALEIGPPSSWAALDGAIARLSEFDWLILTSANGVESVFARLAVAGLDARALAGLKIAVVGKKTAEVLAQFGLRPDFVPPQYVAEALIEHFPVDPAGQRLLFPRVESGGREALALALGDRGAQVSQVAAYESRCPAAIAPAAREALLARRVDAITFASSKTAQHFALLLERAGLEAADCLQGVAIASIGPQTSATCQACFGRWDVEATEYTLDGLAAAIVAWVTAD